MLLKLINTFFRSHISHMVAKVYIPTLFPLTFLISLVAIWMDRSFGFTPIVDQGVNYWLAAFTFITGVVAWLATYEQLSRIGEGSPSPTAGRTMKLVTTGIYAYSRNPSIFGKLIGFFSIGLLLNSPAFCWILTPLLLTGSLLEKVWRQEPQLIEMFGEEYEQYRSEVPLFFPWKVLSPTKNK